MSKCECKNCIHEKVCRIREFPSIQEILEDGCNKYKDKSLFVELPCKVGEIVYAPLMKWLWTDDIIVQYQITNITITQNKKGEWVKKYRAMQFENGKTIDWQLNFAFDDIGKTVLLTKEQAEAKLKEIEGK